MATSPPSGWLNPAATLKAGTSTPFPSITSSGTSGMASQMAGMSPHGGGSTGATTGAAAQNPYGTLSGPGILEQWFGQRASGTDPGYQYAMKRGLTDLNTGYAAKGAFNSGAAAQGASDFEAKMAAARESQLDQLAAGASGEYQNRLNTLFGTGTGIASGEAGLAGSYDLGSANALSNANTAAVGMGLAKAGVDSKADQQLLNNGFSLAGLYGGIKPSTGATGGGIQPNGLMAPSS